MDMTGDKLIAAPRQAVWDALNNPDILKQCIPGCESIEKLSDTQMKATAAIKLGPIAARFNGNVLLSELDPPNGYKISGEGQGGVAGFAKGGATVTLADEAGGTRLAYVVNAQIGGKMAQLGARLIDSTAKQMAEAFFTKFSAILAPEPEMTASPAHAAAHQTHDDEHDPSNPRVLGLPLGVLIAAVCATIAVGLTCFKYLF